MKRRHFLQALGTTSLGLSIMQYAMANGFAKEIAQLDTTGPVPGPTGAKGRIAVIGGGMAGTTIAKYLRLWGGADVRVGLIEPNATYYSNIFSNMVITGERTLDQLAFTYDQLKSKYGVTVVPNSVVSIDPGQKKIRLNNGTSIGYDRLVIAPGIEFDPLPITGMPSAIKKVVHAWKAGPQTISLRNQVQSMTSKDTYILTIPAAPYRCPPGPYERACVVADYLKRVKGGGKVIVLDANASILAEPENFSHAFNVIHKDVITYVPGALLTGIDADTRTVTTSKGTFRGRVINAIPSQKAGNLITQSGIGLNNAGNGKWAGVNVLTYESTAVPNIHIIGDSSSTTQPKAGHIANAEAKVCAAAIIQLLQGEPVNQSPVTNSACFTPITHTTASWLSVVFKYDPLSGNMVATGNGVTESNGATTEYYEDMLKWFNNLMLDTFS